MSRLCLVLVLLSLSSSLVFAQSDDDPTTTPTVITTPTTTTTKPTSTTTKPTTPPSTTTTTRATTTGKPDVVPDFPKNGGTWIVNSTNNVSCLVLDAAFQISVTHKNDKNQSETVLINIPPHAKGTGTCDSDKSATLSIEWPVTGGDSSQLSLAFRRGNDSKGQGKEVFELHEVRVKVTINDNENGTETVVATQTFTDVNARFRAPLNKSYACTKEPAIKFENDTNVELKVGKLQVEAFRSTPFDKFSAEFECSADDVSAVVPFAVGASLALLVVIVLIAYLIGRRRSRARGYQSV